MRGQRHVRRRVVTLFVLGIALPSGLLGYLALRGVRNDQALFEREQREALERAGRRAFATHDESLTGLGRRFTEALARTGEPPADASPRALEGFVSREPLVDALFRIGPAGLDACVVAAHLYGEEGVAPTSGVSPAGSPPVDRDLERARRAELRDQDLSSALTAYESVAGRSGDTTARAEALNGIARIHRNLGDLDAATNAYRRLVSEYGNVRSGGGIPFGIAGRLELLRVHESSGDVAAGGREVSSLLRSLLAADHGLTAAQYSFVADRTRAFAEGLLAGPLPTDASVGPTDSLRALLDAETAARSRSERVDRFRAALKRDPGIVGRHAAVDSVSSLRLETVRIEGESHYVVLLERARRTAGSTPGEWGLLLDPAELRRSLEMAVAESASPGELEWALRDDTGALAAGAVPDGVEVPSIRLGVPDRFPALTLQMFAAPTGAVESFFTSPRSVYLYAFVLVAGLLAFGLVFTVRTLGHQLALSRMQSDFVSTVSHEFKSPVTAIRQLAEMLQADRVPSESRRRQYYDVLVEQSERLTALMNHILDFARMDAGYVVERQELDPGPHLEELANRFQQQVSHRGYTIHREIEDDLPVVRLDPDAIALAVTNLMDNGIKYSGDAREVILRVAARNGDLEIAVQDFGVGVDPADRGHVFERFYRGGSPLTRSVKGTGLGLTLVKQIVDAHGGSIELESEPGEGSTFTIRLPTGTT